MELSDVIRRIETNSELLTRKFSGRQFGYDEQAVKLIDEFIEQQRSRLNPELSPLKNLLGSFLGECIRRNFGGSWGQMDEGLAIVFDGKNCCFPFNKVEKQFANGAEDSVLSFYQMIPIVFSLKNLAGDQENAD